MQIAVCEDNKHHLGVMEYLLDRYKETHPGVEITWDGYTNGLRLLEGLRKGQKYDVFILETVLPDMSGIAVAEAIRGEHPEAQIIFLTASTDYALDAYYLSAMQYMQKPIRETKLFPVLDRVVAVLDAANKATPFFLVSTGEEIKSILQSSLVCVESQRRTLILYLSDGSTVRSKPFRGNFEAAIAPLMKAGRFLHAHKSFVLNMDHVRKITDRSFTMTGEVEIFVPRYKFADMKGRYIDYVSSMGGGLLGDSTSMRSVYFSAPAKQESSFS